MGDFRQAWTSLLSWLPSPIRVAIAIIIAAWIVTKIAPRIVRWLGAVLQSAWTPMVELLTYPEYIFTSLCRRMGRKPVPGTHAYGTALGAIAAGGTRLGQWLRNRFKVYPRFPLKTIIVIVVALIACWYATPHIPDGGPRKVLGHVNTDVVRLDSWLATGKWQGATVTPATSSCPARHTPSAAKARKRNRKQRHHRHKRQLRG